MKKTSIILISLLVIVTIFLIIMNIVVIVESEKAFYKSDECERLGGTGVVDRGYRVICLKDSALLQEEGK